MLEITGNEITELSDSDLRALIGLLCEAELRANRIPTACVTWGGHQNATDEGIDVRVELTTILHRDSFIPRPKTGFQIKKPDMPRASIKNEMRPNGELRQSIKDLIDTDGAYIIVSSQGSTSDSALKNRKNAMQEALSDYPNASNIKTDFYDRERVAGWVRSHPSIVLWVRDKIGQSVQGWKAYGNWANCPGGLEEEFFLDNQVRLYYSVNPRLNGLSLRDGINEIRNILHRPASSIRLVGLSGVGKTRLVQALFDERIGERPLNKSRVFYSDISDSPNPDPRNFAERLIAFREPSSLVIDNCPPDLHRRLTSVCSASGSLISLITIEYDVKDDQPEETEVFHLEPTSTEIIKKIISTRFSHVSQVDVSTIAEFSGGNARIAIALANTIQRGENLSNLRDNELFVRLFQQRNEPNNSLLKVAEVCSLVYSFDGNLVEGADAELNIIGSLIEISAHEAYENVSELKRRNLVQQRGIWRAVLPHAIANKLASRALENIPLNDIYEVFEKGSSERLLKSFSRRLSYLHECDVAVEISKKWLSKDGLLSDIRKLNELGITVFKNIASVNPELTLTAIEKVSNLDDAKDFYSRDNSYYNEFTRILRSLAYDKGLFERSAELLCRFALSERPNENYNSIRKMLKSLFYIYLSGSHATPDQRLKIIKRLIESNNEEQIILSMYLLDASLESWHFSSSHGFEFGARTRDFGFSPSNREEVRQWFKLFIEYTVNLAKNDFSLETKLKDLLAKKFRGLWVKACMYDELEFAAKKFLNKGSWGKGWIAVRTTMKYHGKDMEPEIISRLNNLDAMLKPTSLIEKARLFAFSTQASSLDLSDTIEKEYDKPSVNYLAVEKTTRSLGRDVGRNNSVFKEMLPELLSNHAARLFVFGQGLAEGGTNPEEMWKDFREQLTSLEENTRSYQVLGGFLKRISEIERSLSEKLLYEAVTDDNLAVIYPWLETSKEIDRKGVERLKKSLEYGTAPICQFRSLAYGRAHETVCDDDLCELLSIISSKNGGLEVSIDILHMRLSGQAKENSISDKIVTLGQELLLNYDFTRKEKSNLEMDYAMATIVKACFIDEATDNAKILCKKIAESYTDHNVYTLDFKDILIAISTVHPKVFLDIFLEEEVIDDFWIDRMFRADLGVHNDPMEHISDDLLIDWCEENPEIRYPKLASSIVPFRKTIKGNLLEWTPLALVIMGNSPAPINILNTFKATFRPTSWSGSRANVMQRYMSLILELKEHENLSVSSWACDAEKTFEQEIRLEREWELKRESQENHGFE